MIVAEMAQVGDTVYSAGDKHWQAAEWTVVEAPRAGRGLVVLTVERTRNGRVVRDTLTSKVGWSYPESSPST